MRSHHHLIYIDFRLSLRKRSIMASLTRRIVGLGALLMLPLVAACGSQSNSGGTSITLNVFAAASLTGAFGEAGTNFTHTHPNVHVTFNFGGSNALATDIIQGQPADVFASANQAQMDNVIKAGDIAQGADKVFVHNRLVVITPKDNPAKINQLQDLAKPGLKIILAAKEVPVGGYALTFLDKASADPSFSADYKTRVLANVVSYEQDVKVVFSKVQLGEGDAGIVYTSDVAANASAVNEIAIPDALNVIASYPIAPVKGSANASAANDFITYILSPDGQAVLTKYGFIAANG
jgi:molybdate transport system substrate-binding protein